MVALVPAASYNLENMRVLASALFNIGYCNQQLKQSDEAGAAFRKAVGVIRACVVTELRRNGSASASESTPDEELVRPSVFDSEVVRDLKALMAELLGQAQDACEQKQIDAQLEQLKKEEGQQADPNFGKAQANADQFADVSALVKKKRTHEDMAKGGPEPVA